MCLGIPGQIVEITDSEFKLATVDVSGVRRQVNVACVVDDEHPIESCVGDWVLVHVGFAMSRIDEEEAARTLEVLRQLGEVQLELEAMRGSEGGDRVITEEAGG
jgi:hydrogenase expression/formation protein HypC